MLKGYMASKNPHNSSFYTYHLRLIALKFIGAVCFLLSASLGGALTYLIWQNGNKDLALLTALITGICNILSAALGYVAGLYTPGPNDARRGGDTVRIEQPENQPIPTKETE